MKVVLCWSGYTGYIAACWHALYRRGGVDFSIFTYGPDAGIGAGTPFAADLLRGLPCHLLTRQQLADPRGVADRVVAEQPDLVIMSGWHVPAYVRLAYDRRLSNARFVLMMDTPFRGTWRQYGAKVVLRRFRSRMSGIIVPGERAWQYARFLGFPEHAIHRGLYGADYNRFRGCYEQRLRVESGGWPRKFLYVGRYAKEKAIDVLVQAYRDYRSSVDEPWPLTTCGVGPLTAALRAEIGIVDRGFLRPEDLPEVFTGHGGFVFPSRYEPWGVALVEALAAGLPAICTEACGASVELLRSYYNGVTVATGSAPDLARAMRWMHDHHAALPEMGRRGQAYAAAYSAEAWADRWANLIDEVIARA